MYGNKYTYRSTAKTSAFRQMISKFDVAYCTSIGLGISIILRMAQVQLDEKQLIPIINFHYFDATVRLSNHFAYVIQKNLNKLLSVVNSFLLIFAGDNDSQIFRTTRISKPPNPCNLFLIRFRVKMCDVVSCFQRYRPKSHRSVASCRVIN